MNFKPYLLIDSSVGVGSLAKLLGQITLLVMEQQEESVMNKEKKSIQLKNVLDNIKSQ